MRYEFNFGTLGNVPPKRAGKGGEVFRLAVLGDFSARANRGEVEVGEALAARKPLAVEIDNLEDLMGRLDVKLQLDVGGDEGTIEVDIPSIDSFHPDELYDRLEIFTQLSGLRRRLTSSATFAKAAKDVQAWLAPASGKKKRRKAKPRGAVLAANCKLSDFARLLGRGPTEREATPVEQLLKQVVGPHVVPAKDPKQDALVAAVDAAIAETMRRVLHHPDFQATEALWRSLDLLLRNLETGSNLKVVLYDITAEELAADLSATESLEETGLYKLLVEKPAQDAQQGPLSAIVANYVFEKTPPHAELLGRIAKIAAAAVAPFIANVGAQVLEKRKPGEEEHPLVAESWRGLKALPEAAHLALTVPRFMLRNPYGKKSDPIDRFAFEEFTPQYGLKGMLWGNSSILAGMLLGQTFTKQGLKKMNIGSILSVGDMPYYFFTDKDGDQVALPCTERLLNVRLAADVSAAGFIPVLSILNRNEVRLGGFSSLAGKTICGPWPAKVEPQLPAASKKPEPAAAEEDSSSSESADSDGSSSDSGGSDTDMDALLASLGGSDDSSSDSGFSDSGDSSDGGTSDTASDDSAMDPELAALLAELG
jgi:type VI secretion system protein ImpC